MLKPEHIYFFTDENGVVDVTFNGNRAPTKERVAAVRDALTKFIEEWDEEDIARYNLEVDNHYYDR